MDDSALRNGTMFAVQQAVQPKSWGVIAALCTVGCGGIVRLPDPVECSKWVVQGPTTSRVDKIDLLLLIDNSRSMADKQEILQLAVPDLIEQLVNPKCFDEDGNLAPPNQQPTGPIGPDNDIGYCPNKGHKREFEPVTDIHIGVLSSSLGGHGADACEAVANPSENDKGHLLDRVDTSGMNPPVPTYQSLKFLAWDPDKQAQDHA